MADFDVHARMTLEDDASPGLGRIKHGLDETGERAHHAGEEMGFAEHMLSNFAAIELSGVFDQVRETASEFIKVAEEAQTANEAVGALIAAVQDKGIGDAVEQAGALGDEMNEVAMRSHQAAGAVKGAFEGILEITGATEQGIAKATHQVEEMSRVATFLGKDVGAISSEFAMMEEGVVRTKGQLFRVLNTTGIFGDNIHKASEGWQKLTEEERVRRLEYALQKLNGNIADATPTFAQAKTTLGDIVEVMQEKMGAPVLAAITPELAHLADELKAGIPTIEEFGKEMSVDVAKWVHEAGDEIQHGFDYIRSHGKEIHDDIVGAVEVVKDVVDFIISHKEEIAIAFGAKAAVGLAGGVARTLGESGPGRAVIGGAGALYNAGAAGGGFMGVGGMAGGVQALGAFGAAAGAWLLAGEQLGKLYSEMEADSRKDFDAIKRGMQDMTSESTQWTQTETDAFHRMRDNLIDAAAALGEDAGAAAQYADSLEKQHGFHAKNMAMAESLKAMAGSFEVLAADAQFSVDHAKNQAEAAAAAAEQAAFGEGTGADVVNQFATGFEALRNAHDQAAMNYVGGLLANSKNLTASFLASAQLTDEGWKALADSIESGGSQFKDIAQMFRDQIKGGAEKLTMKPPNFNFSGSTFKIQQDFRDQDPDRVALQFKEDLTREATNRLGSGFSTPFGA